MIRKITLTTFAIFIYCTLNAQQTLPKTFLWRITGNGLTKPSYLYGTIHLQDRNLFYFGDSIYHAIESSEGFAIEINPVDMADTLFKIFAVADNSPLIKDLISKKEYQKISDKLSKKLKISADKITTKKIADERRNWLSKNRKKDDMSTFMDMYFYTIAQNLGKCVGGIEDIEDQVGLLDDAGSMNMEDYLQEDDAARLKSLDQMKSIYINRDLDKIKNLTYRSNGSALNDEILIKRNLKMARRLDSLAQIRNSFFAVGAAHLPGDSGVIALLKKRGFNVEPIVSSKYLKPEDYHYTKKEIEWIDVTDDHKISAVKMPGQPTLINLSNVIPMKMYLDLSDIFCYGISVMPMASGIENDDSIFLKLIATYKSEGFGIISTKKIEELGAKGIVMTLKYEEQYMRFKVLIKSNKLFLLIFAAQQEEKLNAPESAKFFNSLKINDANLTQQIVWQVFTDKQNAFSISEPAQPILKFDKGTSKTFYDVYTYTSSDYSDGSYYMLVIKNSLPGYYVNNDSLILEEYKKKFNESNDTGMIQTSKISIDGYRGYSLAAIKKYEGKDYAFRIDIIFRGNRIYMPMAITEKGKENFENINNFFNSFTFLPFEQNQWKQHNSPANNFTAWTPSEFQLKKADSSSIKALKLQTSIASDKKSIVDYSVESEPLSKYFWSSSDSSFYGKMANTFKSAKDSLIYYHMFSDDTTGAEVLIKLYNSSLYKRLRILLNGDTLYTVYTYFPRELKDDKNMNLFFSGFKFTNPQSNTIFINKRDQLLTALLSTDSTIRNNALNVLDEINFAKSDLDFLHKVWIKLYPSDLNRYRSISYYIGKKIEDLSDSLTIDFIDNNYPDFNNVQPGLQMNMLEVLESFKTKKSYALIKKLLLSHAPSSGSIYTFSNGLTDSLLLSKDLFPEISNLYADSIIGGALIRLTVDLLDSNKMNIEDVNRYAELIYSFAKKQLSEIKNNTDEYPVYNSYLINILQKLNSKQAISLLKSFLQFGNIGIRYNSAIALAKLNQLISPLVINSIAEDKGYRTELYSSLKKINKADLYPKEFLTQQKFAEAYLYNYISEDEDSVTIESKGERIAKINGHLQRYYLFKVNIVEDDASTSNLAASNLAACGPFKIDKKEVEISDDDLQVNVFYDEEYKSSSTERLFQQFIESLAEKVSK